MTIRILNLYSGIGGNRKLWNGDIQVTAVEINPEIADIYKRNFPNDTVIVGDAKEFLLNHFQEYDFIWASPPCPTHSRMRTLWKSDGTGSGKTSGTSFKMPDMDLYSIIIFLQHFYNGNWVVENVISYYDPLIQPYVLDNHYFWSNKNLGTLKAKSRNILDQDLERKSKLLGIEVPETENGVRWNRQLMTNCVKPEVGLHILNMVYKETQTKLGDSIGKEIQESQL